MDNKIKEVIEEFLTVVLENGNPKNLEKSKNECEEIIKICTVDKNDDATLTNLYTAMSWYCMIPGMKTNMRKQMVWSVILTQSLFMYGVWKRTRSISRKNIFVHI